MRAAPIDSRFERAGKRHRFTARRLRVVEISNPAGPFVRVRLDGPALADFEASGPADHVRVYFPDPVTGILNGPTGLGPGEDGILPGAQPAFGRDFTPLTQLTEEGRLQSLEIDIFSHDAPGPAAIWAAGAKTGDELIVVGPRGSRRAPQQVGRIILIVDETALPSGGRWIADASVETEIDVIVTVSSSTLGNGEWVRDYLSAAADRPFGLHLSVEDPIRRLREVEFDKSTFVFAAGEAERLIAVRRYLKHDLGLPPYSFSISGYWKRGSVAFDHHAPIDPDDAAD